MLSGGGDDNYDLRLVPGTLTVTKAPLTVTADHRSRAYGMPNPSLTITYAGFANGEDVSVIDEQPSINTTATPTSDTGAYPITLTGGSDDNYDLMLVNGTLTVTKAPLTVRTEDKTRPYGTPNPPLTIVYSGFTSDDDPSVLDEPPLPITTAVATSGVGGYPIALTGGSDQNYELLPVSGTLTVTRTPLTASAQNLSRAYGAVNPPLTIVYSGFANGDTAAVVDTPPVASTEAGVANVPGNYPITLSGGGDDNYALTLVPGTLTVTKATLLVTAENHSRVYGSANPALTRAYNGFANGEGAGVIDTLPVIATTATIASPPGTYPITLTGGGDDHYELVLVPGTLTVTKAVLTARATDASRRYGGANPAFGIGYTGFVNGELEPVIDTPPLATTAANAASPIGTYPITLSGGSDDRYTFEFTAGTLTVTKAPLTVRANDAARAYGSANPTFTAAFLGMLNGDTVAVVSGAPGFSTATDSASPVGAYPIVPTSGTLAAANYEFTTFENGTLSVAPAVLTVTVNNAARAYGAANPVFSGTVNGVVNGDGITASYTTAATVASPVGGYPIIPVFSDPAGRLGNYTVVTNAGTLTVTAAALTVTANNASRVYGDANPPLNGTLTGTANGDDLMATFTTEATPGSSVGTYAILPLLSDPQGRLGNYAVTTNAGTLTVTKAALTVTPANVSRPYGAANPVLNGSISGLKNSDNISASYSTTAAISSPVGDYPITASVNDPNGRLPNYQMTLSSGVLKVTADDPPVVTLGRDIMVYVEGSGHVLLDNAAMVTDGGSANFQGGTLTVELTENGASEDRLSVRHQGFGAGQIGRFSSFVSYSGQTLGTFSGGNNGTSPLTITFNSFTATPLAVQALIRNLTYQNVSTTPSEAPRVIRFILTDGDGGTSVPETMTIQVVSTNAPPIVALTYPVNQQALKAGTDHVLAAAVTDPDGTIVKVEFLAGYVRLGEVNTPPFTLTWPTPAFGSHILTVRATDNEGAVTTSAAVNVSVNPAIHAPVLVPAGETTEFRMTFTGVPGVQYVVETSTNLADWTLLTTIVGAAEGVPVVDPHTLGVGQRFYRIRPASP